MCVRICTYLCVRVYNRRIGLSESDDRAYDEATWKGTNLLGIALMRVRETLRAEESQKPNKRGEKEEKEKKESKEKKEEK